ncbi:MAG TPA: sugar phosphate isomerase/epimerase [Streptosporangiaceae bacterium]|jgi:sugar phosphate isomerase/epimerase|nr:sugar phosphate isomerase/epimerase [Streptosporangiaceae bacterium]
MRRERKLNLNRRGFIGVAGGTAATALLGAFGAPAAASDAATSDTATSGGGRRGRLIPPGRLGIQLFTIRDKVASLGFAAVFEELVRDGYAEVEFAGYTQGSVGAITIPQIKRLLDDNGLRGIGSHVGYFSSDPNAYTFATKLDQVLDDAAALDLPYIGTASSPARYGNTVDAWKRACAEFNAFGAAAAQRGMKFYQHNHAEEFGFATDQPSVRLYDVLLAETDPELVALEMDIFWAFSGQFRFSSRPDPNNPSGPPIPEPFEPLDFVLAAPERYPLFHVKDGDFDPTVRDGFRMTDVGDGDIDYQRFISALQRSAGGRHRGRHNYLVERDDAPSPATNPAGSFSTAQRSFDFLSSLRG